MTIHEGQVFFINGDPDAAIQVAAVFDDGAILIAYPGRPDQGTTLVEMSYWPELCERLAITAVPKARASAKPVDGAAPAAAGA